MIHRFWHLYVFMIDELVDCGLMSDTIYAEVFGHDRHGNLVLDEDEEIEREPYYPGAGRTWDDHGGQTGDAAGAGGNFD